jgi:lipopolysaccharide export system protein LptA
MRTPTLLSASLVFCALAFAGAGAQDVGSAFAGFDSNSNEPVQIEADRLEVNDVDKIATYTGNVRVRQGGTILEAPELVVHYSGDAAAEGGTDSAAAGGTTSSRVSRMEAGPGVVVRTSTQTATGEHIVFDMPNDLVTLEGDVILTEGESVVRGDRLIVNLTTKIGHVEGGRVQTLITPSGGAPGAQ